MKYIQKSIWMLAPSIGVIIFCALYYFATTLYPGGTEGNKTSKGFNWVDNYWCNLLNENAINGEPNAGRNVAIAALVILCTSITLFFVVFSKYSGVNKKTARIINVSALISMFIILFISSRYHDSIVNISGFFGLIALLATHIVMYKIKWQGLFWFGVFNLVLVATNNFIYNTGMFFSYLAIIQKLTFLSFFIWLCMVNFKLYLLADKLSSMAPDV